MTMGTGKHMAHADSTMSGGLTTHESFATQLATKALRLTVAVAFEIRDSRAVRAAVGAADHCRRWLF